MRQERVGAEPPAHTAGLSLFHVFRIPTQVHPGSPGEGHSFQTCSQACEKAVTQAVLDQGGHCSSWPPLGWPSLGWQASPVLFFRQRTIPASLPSLCIEGRSRGFLTMKASAFEKKGAETTIHEDAAAVF